MTLIDKLSRLLLAPPASGRKALLIGILLIAVPTGIRFLIDDIVHSRLPFFAFIPFVILGGALLSWRGAALVAVCSWLVADLLYMEPRYTIDFDPIELIGFAVFAVSAILIIGLVESVRTIVDNSLRPARPEGFSTPVVFSLERGQAWASWYGSHSWVRLGPDEEVAEMMRDFLAQRELGKKFDQAIAAAGSQAN
jgi:hypothetical protein